MHFLAVVQATSRSVFSRSRRLFATVLVGGIAALATQSTLAATFTLGIQPVLPEKQIRRSYAPLAAYLAQATGHQFTIKSAKNFFSYWTQAQRGDFDLTLDAAHFTGYRAKHHGFKVLAKIQDEVSYSLVTSGDTFILDPAELVGKPVATMAPPSLGAIRLEQWFDNPMREPLIRVVNSASEAIDELQNGRVVAAIIPTPMVSTHEGLNTVQTTDAAPHMAISAAPAMPAEVQSAIRQALVNATASESGRAMLEKLKINGFEATSAALYLPYSALLEQGRLSALTVAPTPEAPLALATLPARK